MSDDISIESVPAGKVADATPPANRKPARRWSPTTYIKQRIDELRDFPARFREAQIRGVGKVARRYARERVHAFNTIAGIPHSRELTATLIHVAARVGLLTAKRSRAANAFLIPTMTVIVLTVIALPILITRFYAQSIEGLAFLGFWIASYLGFAFILLVIGAPLIFFRSPKTPLTNLIGLFWLTFGLFTCGFAAYRLHAALTVPGDSWILLTIQSALLQTLIYFVGSMLLLVISSGVSRGVSSRLERRIPDAMFVDSILRALQIVRLPERDWQNLRSKNELMRELERAARLAGEGIPRALLPADPQTDAWLKNHCQEIAAALRAKKSWVCMPKPDTRQQLEDRLTKCLVDAARGSWDTLERAERRPLSRQELKLRLGKFLIAIFVAVLPAAVYRLAQQSGFLSPGALGDYLGFGVVLWGVIALLLAIDPRFGEKVEAVQKLVSVVPGLPKKEA